MRIAAARATVLMVLSVLTGLVAAPDAAVAAPAAASRITDPAVAGSAAADVCKIQYVVIRDTGSAFESEILITNLGPAINGWTLAFVFPGNQQMTGAKGGSYSQTGQSVSLVNAPYNANVDNGKSVLISIRGSYSGENASPSSFSINGAACTG